MLCPKCKKFAKIDSRDHGVHLGHCEKCGLSLKETVTMCMMDWGGYTQTVYVKTVPESEYTYCKTSIADV